jgi:uncharacterized protein (TIGR02217 family)
MAFLESRISARVTTGLNFTVMHPKRDKVYAYGGRLQQAFSDSPPLLRVDLAHGVRDVSSYNEIMDAFYVVMFTPYEGLRVKNWQDYRATAANSAVTALGGGEYQLQRRHSFGGINYLRDITKPVSGTVAVFDAGGTPLTPTVDTTDGTFTVAAGTPSYWTGEFDIPMTFASNEWSARIEGGAGNPFVVFGEIQLEEILT